MADFYTAYASNGGVATGQTIDAEMKSNVDALVRRAVIVNSCDPDVLTRTNKLLGVSVRPGGDGSSHAIQDAARRYVSDKMWSEVEKTLTVTQRLVLPSPSIIDVERAFPYSNSVKLVIWVFNGTRDFHRIAKSSSVIGVNAILTCMRNVMATEVPGRVGNVDVRYGSYAQCLYDESTTRIATTVFETNVTYFGTDEEEFGVSKLKVLWHERQKPDAALNEFLNAHVGNVVHSVYSCMGDIVAMIAHEVYATKVAKSFYDRALGCGFTIKEINGRVVITEAPCDFDHVATTYDHDLGQYCANADTTTLPSVSRVTHKTICAKRDFILVKGNVMGVKVHACQGAAIRMGPMYSLLYYNDPRFREEPLEDQIFTLCGDAGPQPEDGRLRRDCRCDREERR
jgi:hypothetical protein